MAKKLAVLHTSFVFINVETMMNDLFKEILKDTEVIHFVDSSLLAQVMAAGKVTDESVRRMTWLAKAAEESGADLILSACSSLGPAVDVARHLVKTPIIKIDDAMAQAAAEKANKVGVLATVPTTLAPTAELIREKAEGLGKPIEVSPKLCEGAFERLMAGQRESHDEMVLAGARELAPRVELIALAQASMTRLAPKLSQETGLPVLSSPRLGIEYITHLLEQS
ncbi:MAG: aspartate/glutamate racemase family protein [Anaerolineae bacterium]